MGIRVNPAGFGFLVLLGAVVGGGCGGGSEGSDESEGGSDGAGARGGSSSSQEGPGLPSRLPDDEAECSSATGVDGCFFDACCAELVACGENAACVTTFGCYRDCAVDDSDCFVACAGSALAEGAEDFSSALSCSLLAGISCGGSPSGAGGSGGSPGSGGSGGSAGDDVGPLGTVTDELGWNLSVAEDPLTAELTPDSERAVEQEVTLDGGTVTATAEDGTVFELTIPEGALYGPTVITLTPLRSVEVPDLEGPAYGVQIEPDGLPLMGAPTLAITPSEDADWSVDQQLPLATTGEENTVSLALLDPESEPLRFVLTHFSSYVVLFAEKGIDAKLSQSDIRRRFGGAEAERIASATAERLAKARANGGMDTTAQDALSELFAEYEKHVLKPRIDKASESCAAAKLATTTMLGFERQRALAGLPDDGRYRLGDFLETLAKVCMREEYEICRDEHIITRVLPALYGFMRQAALGGLIPEVDGVGVPPPWLLQAEQEAKKCLQFELQFDSSVAYADEDATLSMTETVTARVPFGLQASLTVLSEDVIPPGASTVGALIGGGPSEPLESTSYSVHTNEPCRTIDEEYREDGEFFVTYMGFTPGENSPSTPGGSARITDLGLSIAISPNLSSYDFTQQEEEETGCGSETAAGNEVLSWSSTLGSHFLNDLASETDGAWVANWKPVNGDIIATKDLEINESDGSFTSRGPVHLIVFHTPQ